METNPYFIFLIAFAALFITILIVQFYRFFRYKGSSLFSLSKYNEKILRILSKDRNKWFNANKIINKPKYKGEIESSIIWLKKKGYLSINKKGDIKITDKGMERLYESFKEETNNSYKQQEFLTNILIALVGFMLAYGSFQLQSIQTSIMAQSNAPIQATLEFIPDKDDLIIPAFELVDSRFLGDAERWARIDLTMLNFGKMDSNHIHCFQKDYLSELFGYLRPDSNFQNIPSGSSNRSTLHIRYSNCQKEKIQFCDKPELVPLGAQNITLECECYGCKDQRKFEVPIIFCVYNQNKSICDAFEKNLK